jgi:uncharacterized protein with GYD domain
VTGATHNKEEVAMPKYLVAVTYNLDGTKGLMAEGGSSRVAVSKSLVESLGGKLEAFYFAFGDADAYVIVDMPDNVSAAAAALIAKASGGVVDRTVVLLSPDEIDAATKKQGNYRAPGV